MAVKIFYFAYKLRKKKFRLIPRICELILRYTFGIEISTRMVCGTGLQLPHNGLGVVINPKTILGNNVKIHQNVTLGGREGSGCPIIGDNVLIGCGAVLLGDITVGNGAKIGSNAVVLTSVPDDAIAVGIPAVIKEKKR
ncbi:hypothetical protein LJC17_00240 [Acholeplasma sp. OttesenSCG-928-E16]|nr:hypothetical protein [Acholeplasma sp. OttesenSCG-928-E16]